MVLVASAAFTGNQLDITANAAGTAGQINGLVYYS